MSQMGPPAPPDNDEIDINNGGTTIHSESVTPSTDETHINPQAFGTIKTFQVIRNINGVEQQPENIKGVRIPFGANRLQITVDDAGTPTWTFGATTLRAYADRASRNWPSQMVTPSLGTNNATVYYQLSVGEAWSANQFPFGDFVQVNFQTTRPGS